MTWPSVSAPDPGAPDPRVAETAGVGASEAEEIPEPLLALMAEHWPDVPLDGARAFAGMSHDVLVLPDRLAVRLARDPQARAELRRAHPLLTALGRAGLPFAVPQPVGDLVEHRGTIALATDYLPGEPRPLPDPGLSDYAVLADTMAALRRVDLDPVAPYLDVLRGLAGGPDFSRNVDELLLPRLTRGEASAVRRVVDDALALPAPDRPVLVHADLAGSNLRWQGERLTGVLDWDLAFAGDQAYDVGILILAFGVEPVAELVDPDTVARAQRYRAVFRLEALLSGVLRGADGAVDRGLARLRELIAQGHYNQGHHDV